MDKRSKVDCLWSLHLASFLCKSADGYFGFFDELLFRRTLNMMVAEKHSDSPEKSTNYTVHFKAMVIKHLIEVQPALKRGIYPIK